MRAGWPVTPTLFRDRSFSGQAFGDFTAEQFGTGSVSVMGIFQQLPYSANTARQNSGEGYGPVNNSWTSSPVADPTGQNESESEYLLSQTIMSAVG